jgi:glycine/D-amino acid oxidase-like deaminating enzyme
MMAILGEVVPQDVEGHLWDVIVVGTGAGGSTAGFNLARLGRSVLFVERGKLLHHDSTVVRGVPFSWTGRPEKALNHGWWPRPVYYREASSSYGAAHWFRRRWIDSAVWRSHGPVSSARFHTTSVFSGHA